MAMSVGGKRIAVVGAGAVGGYLGAHLAHGGCDVTLIDPWPQHVNAMKANGLSISGMTEAEAITVPVKAIHLTEVQEMAKQKPIDIAIVSVKSYDTIWATNLIAPYLAEDGFVVSAQNSINEERVASVVGWGKTVGCIVANNFAVDLYEPATIRRTMPKEKGIASLEIGEVHGRITPRVRDLVEMFGLIDTTKATTNLWGVRWSKLCVNGMRNGVSAATGLGGNARDSHEIIRRVVIKLAAESVKVGRALGLDLEKVSRVEPELYVRAADGDKAALAELEAIMHGWTQGTARSNLQRPSMAQDMAKGRRTEIDYLNGLVAEKGASVGCPAPTHAALTEIVKRVERGNFLARPENLYDLAR
jgi:2-dehydropantoate 2-reductase